MATETIAARAPAGGPANGVATYEPPDGAAGDGPTARFLPEPPEHLSFPSRRETFGSLARRRRRGVMALLLALLLGLLALAALVGWLGAVEEEVAEVQEPGTDERVVQEEPPVVPEVENEGPRTLEVPYLVGLSLPEAEARLAEAGFEAGELSEIATYVIPAGQVAVQGPPVGTWTDPDTPINLVVSAGPPVETTGSPAGGPGVGQYPDEGSLLPAGDAQYPAGDVGPGPLPQAIPETAGAGLNQDAFAIR